MHSWSMCLVIPADLPIVARILYRNNVSAIDLEAHMPFQIDIPRLREGRVGGFFWSEDARVGVHHMLTGFACLGLYTLAVHRMMRTTMASLLHTGLSGMSMTALFVQ